MKSLAAVAASGVLLILAGGGTWLQAPEGWDGGAADPPVSLAAAIHPAELGDDDLDAVVQRYCVTCHNARRVQGGLVLEDLEVDAADERAEVAEKMILKLRAGMMPPPGVRRPGPDTLLALVEALERTVDEASERAPNPGHRVFQRLNRAEYERSVHAILGLEVDAADWLPLDTKSANFDNIADVQMPSPTLMDAYMSAAAEISRLAVGYLDVGPTSTTYKVPRLASQVERAPGAPRGTRGGTAVTHIFPADGEYVFTTEFHATPTGELYGRAAPFDESIEISVDGVRVAMLGIDRWMTDADPDGLVLQTDPVQVTAGPHMVAAAFVRTFEGPVNDNLAALDHSIADTQIGQEYGINNETHLRDLVVTGPYNVTGISETPTRRRIFTCRPLSGSEEVPCAREILERLATIAYRRPLDDGELGDLLTFYREGAASGGFENGIRIGLQAILASPHFLFRFEEVPQSVERGEVYPVSDVDLASRLSYFLWAAPPDAELLRLAQEEKLRREEVLLGQARRMLADPRSEALATRFAAQWLRLSDLEKVHPDALEYPQYDRQLMQSMLRETELLFEHILREDRPVTELFTASYTFLNERLADHYGVNGVVGEDFRRLEYADDRRAGLLGHASILTLTSHANRTSPVLRGKWVMEVLMGTPPPPPPPGVPDLEETASADGTRPLTTAERMAQHRANPACASCHNFIDPIGLALDNFDVTGRWRIREQGIPLDTRGEFYDGTPLSTPAELRAALLSRPIPLVRNFTVNLMAYALGRRVEYFDMPEVRRITREAATNDNRISSFILGVVQSDAFRMQRRPTTAAAEDPR